MNGPDLAGADIHSLLRSFLRARLLARGQAQYLLDSEGEAFRDWTSCEEAFPAARDLTDMLALEPELADAARLLPVGDWVEKVLAAWKQGPGTVVFRTSGSTGAAVSCPQAGELIVQDARGLAEVFHGRSRVVTLVPVHHGYDFPHLNLTILQPQRLQADRTG